MAMATYPTLGADGTSETAAATFGALLARGSVAPALRLTNAKGQRLRNVEVTRWANGPVHIVSILRHKGPFEPATLSLPQPMYAYDLKNHKALGRHQNIGLTITPYRAMFLALSPQPLGPVALKAAPAVAPGSVQHVGLSAAIADGQRAVKVQVTLPDGRMADWIRPVVLVGKEGATVDVPVAFNDPKGTWTVRATDLYTGETTRTRFQVK